ncbi:MAG: TetR/AcrR family transcriptional regulator [Synergistaceae bacterium]|nr:TetR/AcrR family transcriptional regulator [Synergistaceae bacterium]
MNSLDSSQVSNLAEKRKKISTKQRILDSATHLFSMKGYTETTIREIASLIGVTEASIYNHFPSKNSILEYILEEYSLLVSSNFFRQEKLSELKCNPTVDEILSCVELVYPDGKAEYYAKKLYVILQEQHRNPIVRSFVSECLILSTEHIFLNIINRLKELEVLRADTDPDFWVKIFSSLIYTSASRMLLGIGCCLPSFAEMDLMRDMCSIMLKTCGAGNIQGF